jgi:transcriptional regulator with XRE-family HTH domain
MIQLVQQFGLAVRHLREQHGWTQEQLADEAGINRSYLGEIERASSVPSLAIIGKLALALGTTPALLLDQKDESF